MRTPPVGRLLSGRGLGTFLNFGTDFQAVDDELKMGWVALGLRELPVRVRTAVVTSEGLPIDTVTRALVTFRAQRPAIVARSHTSA